MSSEELYLDEIPDLIIEGDIKGTRTLAAKALEAGVDAQVLITRYLVPAMEEVGRLFECGEYFVSEMLVSARAAGGILELAEPYLAQGEHKATGVVVTGTVKGDMHDIGKNIVNMMLRGSGFQVVDLGTDVGPAKYIQAIREHNPDIIGMSALLTTTMNVMGEIIQAVSNEGMRNQVKILVGGAPITQAFADAVGADGYAPDAAASVRLARRLIEEKKSS
ncbi:MAG: corrinoid protein [Ardenticatenaceae bacterium]|nr:corrinoid protein [Ardenticatenaceae bacterium]HBY96104.1 cobalamin-binding protein [Chloroflexota bacterium]